MADHYGPIILPSHYIYIYVDWLTLHITWIIGFHIGIATNNNMHKDAQGMFFVLFFLRILAFSGKRLIKRNLFIKWDSSILAQNLLLHVSCPAPYKTCCNKNYKQEQFFWNKNTIFLQTGVIVFPNDVSCPSTYKTWSSIHYFAANWDVIVFLKYVLNTWRIMRYVSHLTSCVQTTSSSENQET